MNLDAGSVILRKPEPKDVDALYVQKNDPEVAQSLVGFSMGYTRSDIVAWVDRHHDRRDECLWVVARKEDDRCLGHVAFYQLDHRVRSAEFGIMLGEKSEWGKGLGRRVSQCVIDYGFEMLNLNRISLSVLRTNARAHSLYVSLGFKEEGVLREAQWKAGAYVDLVLMSLLRSDRPRKAAP